MFALAFRVFLWISLFSSIHVASQAQSRLAFRRIGALGDELRETSGLIYWAGALWSINDSGDTTALYALDPHSGSTLRRVIITGIQNRDWESLAQDDTYLYIADMGNNRGNRQDLTIHRVLKSDLLDSAQARTVAAQTPIYFYYPEQEDFAPRSDHNWDAEALYVMEDSLYICTKERGQRFTTWYSLPAQAGRYPAQRRVHLEVNTLVTGADYDPVCKTLALVSYTPRLLHLWIIPAHDRDQLEYVASYRYQKRKLGRFLWKGQLESVCWQPNTQVLYFTTEATPLRKASLYRIDLSTSRK